jgi:hypothetical protein
MLLSAVESTSVSYSAVLLSSALKTVILINDARGSCTYSKKGLGKCLNISLLIPLLHFQFNIKLKISTNK